MPLATFQSFLKCHHYSMTALALSAWHICSSRKECDHTIQTASSLTFTTQHVPSAKQVEVFKPRGLRPKERGSLTLQLQRGSHVAFVRQVQPDAVALPQFSNGIGESPQSTLGMARFLTGILPSRSIFACAVSLTTMFHSGPIASYKGIPTVSPANASQRGLSVLQDVCTDVHIHHALP